MSKLKGERIIILNDFFRLQKKKKKKKRKGLDPSCPKQKKVKLTRLALFICIFLFLSVSPYVFKQKTK
jgi:hypothetical protein